MQSLTEGRLTFKFPDGVEAAKLDDWRFLSQSVPETRSDSAGAMRPLWRRAQMQTM